MMEDLNSKQRKRNLIQIRTSYSSPKWKYFLIQIIFDQKEKVDFAEYSLRSLINHTLRDLLGNLVGSGISLQVEILSFDASSMTSILRVPQKFSVHLWSSLTLVTQSGGIACRIQILKVVPFLTSLEIESNPIQQ
jgi:RNase P/RNase MRP subunit POP5